MNNAAARAWVVTFFTNALILGCGVITGIMTARLLQPEGRGALAAVLFWPQLIAGIGILSLNEAVTYRLSQPQADRRAIASAAFYLALALAAGTAAVGFFLLPHFLGATRAGWVTLGGRYLLLFVPLNFISLSLLAVEHGELRFTRYNLLRGVVPVVYCSSLISLRLLNALTVESAVWANACGNLLATLVGIVNAPEGLASRPSWKEARPLVAAGLRFHVTSVLLMFAGQMDCLLVVTLWDSAAVGIYVVALTVSAAGLGILTNSLHTLMFPTIARRETPAAQGQYLGRGLRYAMLVIVCGTVVLLAVCPWLVPFLFGRMFNGSIVPAMVLLVAYVPLAMRQIIVRSLRGIGEALPGTVAEALTVAVFLLAAYPLGSAFGLAGIAAALLVANCMSLVYISSYLQRRLHLAPRDWWGMNSATLIEMLRHGRSLLFSPQFLTGGAGPLITS